MIQESLKNSKNEQGKQDNYKENINILKNLERALGVYAYMKKTRDGTDEWWDDREVKYGWIEAKTKIYRWHHITTPIISYPRMVNMEIGPTPRQLLSNVASPIISKQPTDISLLCWPLILLFSHSASQTMETLPPLDKLLATVTPMQIKKKPFGI